MSEQKDRMTQLFREPSALPEDLDSSVRTHTAAHSHLQLQLQASNAPWALHMHTCMQNTYTCKTEY